MSSPLQVFKSNLVEYSAAVADILKDNKKALGYADKISRMTNKNMDEYANDWYSQTGKFDKDIASGWQSDLLAKDDCPAVIQEMCIKEAFAVGDDVYDCDEKKEQFRAKLWEYVTVLSKQSKLIAGKSDEEVEGGHDDGFNDTMKNITEQLASILPAGFMDKIQAIAQGIHQDNITDPEELQKRVIADTMRVVTTLLSPDKFK